MWKTTRTATQRTMAAMIALFMVIGLLLNTQVAVFAATAAHPNAVTITVTDEEGGAISGASVTMTVNSTAHGDGYISKTDTTDANGTVEVLPTAAFEESDTLTISATVSKEGYRTDSTTIAGTAITSGDMDLSVVLVNTAIRDVTITGQTLSYTGEAQNAVVVEGIIAGDTVTYQLDSEAASSAVPTVTEVGNYSVRVTVQRVDHDDLVETVTTTVDRAEQTGFAFETPTPADMTYRSGAPFTNTATGGESTGGITYSISSGSAVASIDVGTGMLTLNKRNLFGDVTVVATKASDEHYKEITATYTLSIVGLAAPQPPYLIEGTAGEIGGTKTGWYTSDVVIGVPREDYLISESSSLTEGVWSTGMDVKTTTTFAELYLKNEEDETTDNILDEALTIKIDKVAPSGLTMSYAEPLWETVLETITFGFYNPSVEVTFMVESETGIGESGVDHIDWTYQKQAGAAETIKGDTSGVLMPTLVEVDGKQYYQATLTLPADAVEQYRGSLSFTATDKAGNVSEVGTYQDAHGNTYIVVTDTVAPTVDVAYSMPTRTVSDITYYNNAVDVTVTVTEASFFSEDVHIRATRESAPHDVTVVWTTDPSNSEVHYGTFTLRGDGDYRVFLEYKDRSGNIATDAATKTASYYGDTKYQSHPMTIDTTAPTVSVAYANTAPINTLVDRDGNERMYFDQMQTATVTVTEHNFRAEEVAFTTLAKDVAGTDLGTLGLVSFGEWTSNGDTHTMNITYSGDANYTFDVAYKDLAENSIANYTPDYFTVDQTAPTNLSISYSSSTLETVLEQVSFGFYNAKMSVTVSANDATSMIHQFDYSYLKAAGVSGVNTQLIGQAVEEAGIQYSNGNATATVVFQIPRDVLGSNNQFNGTVEFKVLDRAGKESSTKDNKRIVVDSIAPTATITYNAPVTTENDIAYYDGTVSATVHIAEANFYASDVSVQVQKDGGAAYAVTPTWINNSADSHTGSFTLSEDGDYVVTVTYTDKSSNQMPTYTSGQLTVDTAIEAPTITINGADGNNIAFKDAVVPAIHFEDINYSNYEILLSRTNLSVKDADVTKVFTNGLITETENGGAGTFDTFEEVAENDGIYTLTVKLFDKVGHVSESSIKFTVNRFGSVYEYNEELYALIENGGAYVQSVAEDLVITEYNADKLIADSLVITATLDGRPLSELAYETTPIANEQVTPGQSGWYQYQYTLDKANFEADGVYRIAVASKDATGNQPENTNYDDMDILFRVDTTAPELTSVTGLSEAIINAQDVTVNYNIYDAIGLKSIAVYVNGEQEGDVITDFSTDANNFDGSFTLAESSGVQTVRLVVEDLAGNVTDTDAEEFSSAYAFEKAVTVSTNVFVRWYANTVLFWGSIAGVVVLTAAIAVTVVLKKKKL